MNNYDTAEEIIRAALAAMKLDPSDLGKAVLVNEQFRALLTSRIADALSAERKCAHDSARYLFRGFE